ncbi:MAG: response regulator [Acetobacteraceae bacterium]|nr:response regulator [Acetobacteraceae bacterium]
MPDAADEPTILLVEDEFLIRLSLSEALKDYGFAVIEADAAADAMAILRSDVPIAILLTDIHLGKEVDGLDLARAAREIRPDLAVIYMTGRPRPEEFARHPPREIFIAKPFLPSELARLARSLLATG